MSYAAAYSAADLTTVKASFNATFRFVWIVWIYLFIAYIFIFLFIYLFTYLSIYFPPSSFFPHSLPSSSSSTILSPFYATVQTSDNATFFATDTLAYFTAFFATF